jgi:hypothetical protein
MILTNFIAFFLLMLWDYFCVITKQSSFVFWWGQTIWFLEMCWPFIKDIMTYLMV